MIIVTDTGIDHHGAVNTDAPMYELQARWGYTDTLEPLTRVVVSRARDGVLVWEGDRPGHLADPEILAVARLHLPPAPEWTWLADRRPRPIQAPTPGVEMRMQRDWLDGPADPYRLTSGRLEVEDQVAERARTIVVEAFVEGGDPAVDELRESVEARALAALRSVMAEPLVGGMTLLARHVRVQAERWD